MRSVRMFGRLAQVKCAWISLHQPPGFGFQRKETGRHCAMVVERFTTRLRTTTEPTTYTA